MDLPRDTGCAPSRPLSCPSFYLERPTSTLEAGPTAQHSRVQPQSRGSIPLSSTSTRGKASREQERIRGPGTSHPIWLCRTLQGAVGAGPSAEDGRNIE